MTSLLTVTRYLLIVLPAISSMYLESYASNGKFAFCTLLLLWIAELRRTLTSKSMAPVFLLIEIGYNSWMIYQYQGVLFILTYSTLLSFLHPDKSQFRYTYIFLQFVLFQIGLAGSPAQLYVIADLLFIMSLLLLLHLRSTEINKGEIEQLYDALRRQHYELDEARERLIDYARKVENIAQVEERNRISIDIHDDLGHKLIRLKMMMEAAIHILPYQQKKGMDMIHAVRDQLTESMELLRSTVRRLKPDEASRQSYSLDKLIQDLGADHGITVQYDIEGMPYALYPSMEFILYRNAQESITNAIRHGSATMVHIVLMYEKKQIVMKVSNNGTLPVEQSVKGLGIRGMEERAKLVGGKVHVTINEWYTLTTTLPSDRTQQAN